MRTLPKEVISFIGRVDLNSIYLLRADAERLVLGFPKLPKIDASIDCDGEGRVYNDRIVTEAIYKLSARSGNQQVCRIACTFVATYSYVGEKPSKNTIDSFAKTNALFNTWPYFREFVHTMTSRMDLPKLLVPLFKLPRKEHKDNKK
jgi:hypothetical protein